MHYYKRKDQPNINITVGTYHALNEMIRFVNENPTLNFYEIIKYAYDNDKDKWLFTLCKDSNSLKKYMRSKKEKENIVYINPIFTSFIESRKAEKAYVTRHADEF